MVSRGTFPLNPPERALPLDPEAEPSRAEVNAAPEGLTARMRRTRRYFQLTQAQPKRFALGLEWFTEA